MFEEKVRVPDGWDHVQFGALVSETQLGTVERGCPDGEAGVPLIKMGNLTWGGLNLTDVEQVSLQVLSDCDIQLRRGDILFNTRNSLELVGKSAVWRGEIASATFDNNINRIRLGPAADPEFVNIYMSSEIGKREIRKIAVGSTSVAAVYWKDLQKFSLRLPPLPEQRKIAEILRTWDDAIYQASKIIELRQSHYLAVRDELIDWRDRRRKPLRALVEPIGRAVPRPTGPYRALSIRSHGKGTYVRHVADPSSVDMETLYVAREGDLIVNITFAWEGAVALVPWDHDGCLVSHRFPTFVPSARSANARYLRHALRMPRFTYLLGLVSPGGAGRNRVLNKSDFLDLEVPCPELGMQAAVACALDAAEEAIVKATEYRDALLRQQGGLMQKLLTGEWRVSVDDDEGVAA